MSYECCGYFDTKTSISTIIELIELLGYTKLRDFFHSKDSIGAYIWSKNVDYETFVGVELYLSRDDGKIVVRTRSRAGRSYWDLLQQNRTMKLLRDCCGGYFEGDAGRNRYWKAEGGPPTARESGLYISRWVFNNALMRLKIYIDSRNIEGGFSKTPLIGIQIIDEINPHFFSNSLVIPYLIAIWENYNKSSFIALLKYAKGRENKVFKKIKLTSIQIDLISKGKLSVESAIGENLSFQRPQIICQNYKMIDENLDIYSALVKPYHRRKKSLFVTLDELVNYRNEFVHTGKTYEIMTDEKVKKIIRDIEVVVDRIYDRFGEYYKFQPNRDF